MYTVVYIFEYIVFEYMDYVYYSTSRIYAYYWKSTCMIQIACIILFE